MNLEGRLLGNRYEILEQIGNGGMATVYKAKCHVLNRFVAVKILKDEFTTDNEFIKRFNSEAQAVASLTHPNIVSVYDVGHEGNLYYIVMELIQGKTLKEIIVSEGPIAWKWSLNVAIQIASALETAHKNNIIHRDIKPHNIIITEDGMAKVTDFGIAKAVSNSTITAFGTTIGSVHYFSPEHARGGFTDAKSDLYSLGVVLYEMLTGKVPFDADTPVSVALKHIQETPVEPIKLNPAIPLSVNEIVMKAMQKDTNSRYQNASEMLKDLTFALKNPDGDFVNIVKPQNDFPTQTISTVYTKPIEEKIREKEKNMQNETRQREKKKEKFITKHKVLSIAIGLVLLFVISLVATSFTFKLLKVEDVQIPDVVGLTQEQAEKKIEELNLKSEILEETYNDTIDKGLVISQTPAYMSNYKIKGKSTIGLVISLGQKIVRVPKVVGMTEQEAKEELEALELKVEIKEEPNKKVESGYVISQDVTANSEVGAGSTVKITVSTGVETVQVPNLEGKTEEEAKKAITESGLTLSAVLNSEDTKKENGKVLKQSLEAGSTVEKGSNITITINKIAEVIQGTVNINLKSLLKYTEETETIVDEETGETTTKTKEPGSVKLKVVVGGDTVYSEKQKKDTTNVAVGFSGVGTVTIKVYVDDVLKTTKQLNLNNSTTLTIE